MITLKGIEQYPGLFCLGFEVFMNIAEGGMTINLWFAATQQIEVRPLNN